MNDRYLFRAKRIDNGEWITGYLLVKKKDFYICEKPYECMDEYSSLNGQSYGFGGFKFVDPSTICQCTGLNDKNGKLIWENDILMGHGNPKDIAKVVFGEFFVINVETLERIDKVVGWHYEVIPTDAISKCEPFCIPMPLTDEYIERCEFEVIGSAIDNPELLEVGE